ncbi:hypothetical protein LOTGIDRAFT_143344 [Lottia gigantea]|uniref:Protein NRDE2 homolog n=1 Tax=Lottia gigantea TaxID=225164 RepID=V4AWS9_LOTGI|nr:hypothetical protein LOTGIDRAFT_143344 [Lottia gigantea]ESO97991.1 hypothetical protein LOTGIDRAFT_143344 [Lottia gigantea]
MEGQEVGKSTALEGNTSLLDENSERTAYYNKRLQSEPENVDLWLEFIHFQDKLFADENNRIESASTLAVIEKKLSILEKALEMNPSGLKLKFAQLEIGKTIWEEGKIDKEWETLLNRDPNNFAVWKQYLLRKQCELSKFQVSEVISLYSKCFQAIGQGKGVRDGHNRSKDFIELFHQYLSFLNQCGHVEKAVASFQAVMEFNLFCPEEYRNLDLATLTEHFEDFWNSMVPRFGEEGAKGWKYWSSLRQKQPLSENKETDDKKEEAIIKSKEKCEAWFKIETLRETQNWLPWRPDIEKGETEDNCQDLDSLVLFDDISFVLLTIEDEHALLQLLLAFFDGMGLVSRWQKDLLGIHLPFLNTSLEFCQYGLYELNQLDVLMDESNIPDQNRKYCPSLLQITSNVLKTTFDLFSNEYSLSILTLLWIHLQILHSHGNDTKSQTKILKKSMKNVLKEDRNRNNLIIWNAYVKVLQMLGKNDEALHTAELALMMTAKSSESTDLENYGSLLLCQTYCQILLNFSSTNQSASELTSSNLTKISNSLKCVSENIAYDVTNIKQLSSVEVLKIKRNFQSMINNYFADLYLKKNEIKSLSLVTLVNCAAIFDYVTSGLKSAMFVFDNALSESEALQFCDVLKENLFCVQLNIIKFHMLRSTLSLELLRRTLTLALKSFPNNVRFLKDFVELEERSNISCRRRRYFDASLKELTSPTPVIFAVLSEMKRHEQVSQAGKLGNYWLKSREIIPETGISNRIRSLFERGLQSPYCQHTPLIWRLYIHFEVKMNQIERSKGIFYRSLQQCPAVKVLYMDAIKLFGDEVFQQMVDLMVEKEIRVYLPTEEMDILFNSDSLDTVTP